MVKEGAGLSYVGDGLELERNSPPILCFSNELWLMLYVLRVGRAWQRCYPNCGGGVLLGKGRRFLVDSGVVSDLLGLVLAARVL